MPNPSLDDLPLLRELREDLAAAFRLHEAGERGADALVQQVIEVPPRVGGGLGQNKHHSRSRHLRIGLALTGVAGLAIAAAILLSVIGLGAGTQRASAEWSRWSAVPTRPAAGQTASAERACLAKAPGDVSLSHVLVADIRGPFTLVILTSPDGSGSATCIATPQLVYITGSSPEGPGDTPHPAPAGGVRPQQAEGGFLRSTNGGLEPEHEYSDIEGTVGAGVRTLTLILLNGQRVVPTIENGWFAAWWPSRVRVRTYEVETARGTHSCFRLHSVSAAIGVLRRSSCTG